MAIKTLNDYNIANKKILVRADLNIPIENGKISDNSRLISAIPTIKTIIDKHIAKIIKPIVCGSFSNLKLIIEKKDAKRSKTVVISKKFIEKY